jgi:hypothetical protein
MEMRQMLQSFGYHHKDGRGDTDRKEMLQMQIG